MKLSGIGEFGLIGRIAGLCGKGGRGVIAGIGDDAAAIKTGAGVMLLTSDMLVEGVHFDLGYCPFRALGYKALAVNVSDIAAMGGTPGHCTVSIALGRDRKVEDVEELYRGIAHAAAEFGVGVVGGDTCSSPGPLVISVALTGKAGAGRIIRRSGARPGDLIYVTGTLGDSAAGLEILKAGAGGQGSGGGRPGKFKGPALHLTDRHLRPAPRVKAGRLLAGSGLAASMIDTSDGLSLDLHHILESSGAGATIYPGKLPVSPELLEYAGGKRARELALHGGEDYELLFTARPRAAGSLAGIGRKAGVKFTEVGVVTEGGGASVVTAGGAKRALRPKGYEHFPR